MSFEAKCSEMLVRNTPVPPPAGGGCRFCGGEKKAPWRSLGSLGVLFGALGRRVGHFCGSWAALVAPSGLSKASGRDFDPKWSPK